MKYLEISLAVVVVVGCSFVGYSYLKRHRTPSIPATAATAVGDQTASTTRSDSKPDFLGISFGMTQEEIGKRVDLANCKPLGGDPADVAANVKAIHCEKPHKTVNEANFYFMNNVLFQAHFYFDGKFEDLAQYHSGIEGKFASHFHTVPFGRSSESVQAVASCVARLGSENGCQTEAWLDDGFEVAYVSGYDKAVALIMHDVSALKKLNAAYKEYDSKHQRATASQLGF